MFSFTLFKKNVTSETLEGISAAFCEARDKSGRGASTMPIPVVMKDGFVFGRISYNGKIWASDDALLFNPYAAQ